MLPFLTALVILIAFFIAAPMMGCGDPNREECKKACEKIRHCDKEDPEDKTLDSAWVADCKAACDEADKIDGDAAKCINETKCDDLRKKCGSGI